MPYCNPCGGDFATWPEFYGHETSCADCGGEFCPNIGDHYGYECDDCGTEVNCGAEHNCRALRFQSRRNNGIYSYGYVPTLEFRGSGEYHIGFELEVSADYDANPVYDWCDSNGHRDLLWVTEDSSVDGFEITSHPMTPDYFRSVDWEAFFTMLRDTYWQQSSRDSEPTSHGLHVHVSRTAFKSPATLGRLGYLVSRNREQYERVARRAATHYCTYSTAPVREVLATLPVPQSWLPRRVNYYCSCPDCMRYPDETSRAYVHSRTAYPSQWARKAVERRQGVYPTRGAINLCNSETVEFRFFRSTRSAAEFRDSVGTVVATTEFVRSMQPQHTSVRDRLSWGTYVEFVRDRFPELYPTTAGLPAV